MRQPRRVERTQTPHTAGGTRFGVDIIDRGSQHSVVPFTGDGSDVLSGDGTFKALPTSAGTAWGSITGNIDNQTDLKVALDAKQDTLVLDSALCAFVVNV